MNPSGLAGLLLLVGLTVPGCQSYLRPPSPTALPASPVETLSGRRLLASTEGALLHLAGPRDVAGALGVDLEGVARGLSVTAVRRKGGTLRVGDVIRHVVARVPPRLEAATRAPDSPLTQAVQREQTRRDQAAALLPAPLPRDPAQLLSDPACHPVRGPDDLVGYLTGRGWVVLDVVVERDGALQVVRLFPTDDRQPLPAVRVRPGDTQPLGFEAVSLQEVPPELWPANTPVRWQRPLLVTRVQAESTAARAGLRPLTVIRHLVGILEDEAILEVAGPEGSPVILRMDAVREADRFWMPGLISVQEDTLRSHLGVGPLDLLFHHSTDWHFDPVTGTWRELERLSLLGGTVQVRTDGVAHHRRTTIHFLPLADLVRLDYFVDWLED